MQHRPLDWMVVGFPRSMRIPLQSMAVLVAFTCAVCGCRRSPTPVSGEPDLAVDAAAVADAIRDIVQDRPVYAPSDATGMTDAAVELGPGNQDCYPVMPDGLPGPVSPWATALGGQGFDRGNTIDVDAKGNIVVAGWFDKTMQVGKHKLVANGSDVFVVKFSPQGYPLWAASGGGSEWDTAYGVAADGTGGIYVTGMYQGPATFGSHTLQANGKTDIFVGRLDGCGHWAWVRSGGNPGDYIQFLYETGHGIAVHPGGGVVVSGQVVGASGETAVFGNDSHKLHGEYDVFVARLDSSGTFLWSTATGGAAWEVAQGAAVDSAGNALIGGYFAGTTAFGSVAFSSRGSYDIFAAKLSSSGKLLWAVSAGSKLTDEARAIAVDASGSTYVAGHFAGVAQFGGLSLESKQEFDAFVAKLSSTGTFLWVSQLDGPWGSEHGWGVDATPKGEAVLVGHMRDQIRLGTALYKSAGGADTFVARLDAQGEVVSIALGGGKENDYGYGVAFGPGGDVHLTGEFKGMASFGSIKLGSSSNYEDVFVWRP